MITITTKTTSTATRNITIWLVDSAKFNDNNNNNKNIMTTIIKTIMIITKIMILITVAVLITLITMAAISAKWVLIKKYRLHQTQQRD